MVQPSYSESKRTMSAARYQMLARHSRWLEKNEAAFWPWRAGGRSVELSGFRAPPNVLEGPYDPPVGISTTLTGKLSSPYLRVELDPICPAG